MNNDKRKKLIVIFDFFSLFFGICGVTFGFLSLFALVSFWNGNNPDRQQLLSLIFTGVTLGVDTLSCLSAFISYTFGKTVYKSLNLKETDPVKRKLMQHEKLSFRFDQASFLLGVFGMCFGLTSLLLIIPWKDGVVGNVSETLSKVSEAVTGPAIVLDIISALMIVFALNEYRKYNEIKSISQWIRESASSGRIGRN